MLVKYLFAYRILHTENLTTQSCHSPIVTSTIKSGVLKITKLTIEELTSTESLLF